MKVLVFPFELVVAGTVVNAVDLAAALRDLHGHDPVVFATPGPLLRLVEERRLRFVAAPRAGVHPSPARMRALREVVRAERPDVIHAWDWFQCLDAFYGEHLAAGVPLVATDMEMKIDGILPRSIPTTYGTPELVDAARAAGYRRASLLVPPVDVRQNAPGAVDPGPLRARAGLGDGELAVVTVSRLDSWLKAESLRRTIEVVGAVGRELPVRFVVVGDGDVRGELERLAAGVNAALGRPAVVFTGALVDPRPAYAAADVVVGMGGSALRGMAFGKPVVMVGASGFAAPFTPETAPGFLYRGMWGVGDGAPGNAALEGALRALLADPERRSALGEFSRRFVVEHFGLEAVSAGLAELLREAAASPRRLGVAAADGLRTAGIWALQRRFLPSRWQFSVRGLAARSRAGANR